MPEPDPLLLVGARLACGRGLLLDLVDDFFDRAPVVLDDDVPRAPLPDRALDLWRDFERDDADGLYIDGHLVGTRDDLRLHVLDVGRVTLCGRDVLRLGVVGTVAPAPSLVASLGREPSLLAGGDPAPRSAATRAEAWRRVIVALRGDGGTLDEARVVARRAGLDEERRAAEASRDVARAEAVRLVELTDAEGWPAYHDAAPPVPFSEAVRAHLRLWEHADDVQAFEARLADHDDVVREWRREDAPPPLPLDKRPRAELLRRDGTPASDAARRDFFDLLDLVVTDDPEATRYRNTLDAFRALARHPQYAKPCHDVAAVTRRAKAIRAGFVTSGWLPEKAPPSLAAGVRELFDYVRQVGAAHGPE